MLEALTTKDDFICSLKANLFILVLFFHAA